MPKTCRKVRQSLFTKLALVMVLAVIGINSITYSLYIGLQYGQDTTLNRSLVEYARTLADKLGTPPDIAKARSMASERLMRITHTGPKSWTVGEMKRRFPERFLKLRFSTDDIEVSSIHGFYRVHIHAGDGTALTFDLYPTQAERAALRKYGLISLAGSCLIMLAVYLALRFFLRPIGWLTKGAEAIMDGRLESRVPEKGSGQLRELTETFNQMTTRIETLVSNQQQLLLGVSHELRTPLTRLKLRLEMLDSSVDTSALRNDIIQMETMITSLLDAARMHHSADMISKKRTDACALVSEVVEGYRENAPGVTTTLPGNATFFDADKEKIAMMISILLDNAIKYSEEDSAPVEISLKQEEAGLLIEVRDHGIGIDNNALPHLFEPFYRVDDSRTRSTGGYGLGLHLCKAIATNHGATIHVDSEPGSGTTFTVRFPE